MSDETPTDLTAEVAAVSDGAHTLFIADFNDTSAAHEAYGALKSLEDGRHFAIDGVIVVNRDADGKLEIEKATDHSTKKGLKWGLIGGAALGLVFPPSIIGSAVALGAGGAALGKAHQLHDKIGLEKDLSDAVAPGHSGIVAIVPTPARSRSARPSPRRTASSNTPSVTSWPTTSMPSRTRSRRADPLRRLNRPGPDRRGGPVAACF